MITGKVSCSPKNAYLRCVGKGFSSSLVASPPKAMSYPHLVAMIQI